MLDAPCGFGRHSIPLARAGYRVTGADRSQPLIDEARRRSGGERWPKWVAPTTATCRCRTRASTSS